MRNKIGRGLTLLLTSCSSFLFFASQGISQDIDSNCHNWQVRVDPSLKTPDSEPGKTAVETSVILELARKSSDLPINSNRPLPFDDLTEKEVFEGIDCFLRLKGNKNDSKVSGASRPDVSQTFGATSVEVAALYYISFLFTQKWDFADAPFLLDKTGRLNSDEAVSVAFRSYRTWLEKVRKTGLKEARRKKIAPLAGSGVRWFR